jgi:hypothetical protein
MRGSVSRFWKVKPMLVLFGYLIFRGILFAQEPGCLETTAIGEMASAKTPAELKARRQKAGDSYRSQLVFAARMLEITQNERAAQSLMDLLPKDEFGPEQAVWLSLDQLQNCPSGRIPDSNLNSLYQLQSRLPRDAARAVLLVPDKMFEYVSYALLSVDPESDYAMQMGKVCKVRHKQFVKAVNELSPKDRAWFIEKIFNPDGCRTIFFPEQ